VIVATSVDGYWYLTTPPATAPWVNSRLVGYHRLFFHRLGETR
jgi:hypothetical protein